MGCMQVGDYVDTLLLPSSGLKNATVRWVPGPGEITGVGYALLHCHISPHSDEGCIMKTQLLEQKCVLSAPCFPHASHAVLSYRRALVPLPCLGWRIVGGESGVIGLSQDHALFPRSVRTSTVAHSSALLCVAGKSQRPVVSALGVVQQVLKPVSWRALQWRGGWHHHCSVDNVLCRGGGAHSLVQACEEEAAER